jgi:chromosome segregation ATPase
MRAIETLVAEEIAAEVDKWRARIAFAKKLQQIGGIEELAAQAQEKLDLLNSKIETRLRDSHDTADKIIADARAEAAGISRATDSAKAQLGVLEDQVAARSSELANLVEKIDGAKADYAEIQNGLAALRLEIQRTLAGLKARLEG